MTCRVPLIVRRLFIYLIILCTLRIFFIIKIGDEIVKQREYTNLSSRSTVDEENFKSSPTVIIS